MRLLQLDLRSYGHFEGARPIELQAGSRGLHLIHGPNEAGKSTALRAIRALLFGFPRSTTDTHGREYGTLRVGGAIRNEKGAELAFVRRKRDIKPLWTFDDSETIAPDALAPFLGGLDEGKFVALFSMDHAELVDGGKSILGGGGLVGEMLFAAGSGLARVAEVRRRLEEEMDQLFRTRASTPTINAALAELSEKRRAVDKSMVATGDWVKLDAEIVEARRKLALNDATLPRLDAEKRRMERLRKALTRIALRQQTARELERRRSVPVLSDGFAEFRRTESIAFEMASKKVLDATEAIEKIARELASIDPPDPVLIEAEAIGQLQRDLGVYLHESGNRPALEAKLAHIEANARSRIAGRFPEGSLDDLMRLHALSARGDLIRELAQQLGLLEAACRKARADVDALVDSLPGTVGEPLDLDTPRHSKTLGETIARVASLGDLDGQLAEARAEYHQAEHAAAQTLRALPLWSRSLDDLEASPIPLLATIGRFEADLRGLDESITFASSTLEQLEADRLTVELEMESVQLAGQVPAEEELAASRSSRDRTWSLVRTSWLEARPVDDPPKLAESFEVGLRSADDLADRLRREADGVAAQAQRRAAHRALLARIAATSEDLDRKREARKACLEDWAAAWRPLGIEPRTPREMRDWVAIDRSSLLLQAGEIRERRAKVDRLSKRIGELRSELERGLTRFGQAPDDPGGSLGTVLDQARAAVARVESALRLGVARAEQSKADAALDAWKSRWGAAVEPLGLDAGASPTRANAVLAEVNELIKAGEQVAALRESVEETNRLETRFRASVESLQERLHFETPRANVEQVAGEIKLKLDRAREAKTRLEGLLQRKSDEETKLARVRGDLDRARLALEALVREASCESPDQLPEAIQASDEVKELKVRLREYDAWLVDVADSGTLEDLLEEADATDAESLDARIASLADELAPLQAERDRLLQEIGRGLNKLEAMDGGPAAANAQQLVEEQAAHLAAHVERYARLRLASAVLRDAVERYRKKHQGPVLDRAGGLFARLTAGSFAGLRADFDDKDQPVLLGLRADGTTPLNVEGMSEGTADQLYLALRLASLQTYLDDHEPMPLVVDDILVNFDNARALAALEALGELSKQTQILFFTHHKHLVDLARSALGDDVLFVHHLTCPPASVVDGPADGAAMGIPKPGRKKKEKLAAEET